MPHLSSSGTVGWTSRERVGHVDREAGGVFELWPVAVEFWKLRGVPTRLFDAGSGGRGVFLNAVGAPVRVSWVKVLQVG